MCSLWLLYYIFVSWRNHFFLILQYRKLHSYNNSEQRSLIFESIFQNYLFPMLNANICANLFDNNSPFWSKNLSGRNMCGWGNIFKNENLWFFFLNIVFHLITAPGRLFSGAAIFQPLKIWKIYRLSFLSFNILNSFKADLN